MGQLLNYLNKRSAKAIAKRMKSSYDLIKNLDPKISKKDLYIKSLMQRPGYDKTTASIYYGEKYSYREFVLEIIRRELEETNLGDFFDAVNEVIPEDY